MVALICQFANTIEEPEFSALCPRIAMGTGPNLLPYLGR